MVAYDTLHELHLSASRLHVFLPDTSKSECDVSIHTYTNTQIKYTNTLIHQIHLGSSRHVILPDTSKSVCPILENQIHIYTNTHTTYTNTAIHSSGSKHVSLPDTSKYVCHVLEDQIQSKVQAAFTIIGKLENTQRVDEKSKLQRNTLSQCQCKKCCQG